MSGDGQGAGARGAWTPEERRRACVEAPVGAHWLRPDSRVVERPGWYQVITPSCPGGYLNEVVFSELDGPDGDAVIDATVDEYRRAGLPCKWCVGPWTRPDDMRRRLRARGFTDWDVRGMGCDPGALRLPPVEGVSVARAPDDALDTFLAVSAEGWDQPADDTGPWADSLRTALAAGRRIEAFVASVDGEPVGAATHELKQDGSAYLVGAVVLRAARGRGAYRALLSARLARLEGLGVRWAVTQAREDTSAPILQRLGFETLFTSCCAVLGADDVLLSPATDEAE